MNLEGKNVHPFFSKPSKEYVPDIDAPTNEPPVERSHDDPDSEQVETSPQSGRGRKKRKTENTKSKNSSSSVTKGQTSLERFARLPPTEDVSKGVVSNGEVPTAVSLEDDPNHDRRKRRKTASPEPSMNPPTSAQPAPGHLGWHRQLQAEAGRPMEQERTAVDVSGQQAQDEARELVVEPKQITPKKQIKVSRSGKLLSSPPKPAVEPSRSPRKRRGRPPKAKVSPTVTVIKYGSNSDVASRTAFGQKIEDILNGKKRSAGRPATKKAPTKPAGPPKKPHPFFLGKAAQQKDAPPAKPTAEQRPPTPRKSACTPGKLRAEARRDRSPGPMPTFGMSSTSSRVSKQSGLNEASWPTKETAHVRNLGDGDHVERTMQRTASNPLRPRKMKSNIISLPDKEGVIMRLGRDLSHDIHKKPNLLESGFEPPEDVRLPTRLLTTGIQVQQKVRNRVQAVLPEPGERHQHPKGTHPAVATLFSDIEHTLTPFDEGKCESQAWSQKYSPKLASHVLQPGTEAAILKDWLQSLMVMAVGGALKAATVSDVKKPPRKKRKKAVDDFIVFDDDEEEDDEEMIEIAGGEGMSLHQPRSMRRPQWTRNKNVILISGPHGCGKSATVYAVAKELGFEVFEVNSGMRRSGKDIQDKVGDMTANHLVNHKRSAAPAKEVITIADDTDTDRMDTALQDDLTSGRQGTMTSFFQPKPTAKPTSIAKPKIQEVKSQEAKRASPPAAQAMLPIPLAAPKSQKQSLIFFEEADILFEEDQQFWAQVTKLALNSKRPIVISCNDERQIPMQDLPLAAVLRLSTPPIDLATDYLLVLAGREGHILERQAVSELYKSKNYDLRASITELDLWCQMSVGDRKGGLEWIYQRWPPGKDVDEHGRLLRVASENTYQSGMGWLSHNVFETQTNAAFDKEEELLRQVWTDWDISPVDWVTASDERTAESCQSAQPNRLRDLERLDNYADSLSAADMYCRVGLPTYDYDHDEPTDPSLPSVTNKARLSYTLAAPLLQVDHSSDFLDLDTSLSTQTHLLIQRAYPDFSHRISCHGMSKPTTETDYVKTILASQDKQKQNNMLSRLDFAAALDILAAPPDHTLLERTSYNLTPSSFDRTFSIITLDLAPYVRSIVAHEQILEAQRLRISNLLSAGGNGKRPRTTRAARTALEGGVRETKRRDRWFDNSLNFNTVMRTAGEEWAGLGWKSEQGEGDEGTECLAGTLDGAQDAEDVSMQDEQEVE